MSRLTPGDWVAVRGPGNGKRLPSIVTESREKTIATIHFPNERPDAADFQEAYANLHAMAAAPKLLAACQRSIDVLRVAVRAGLRGFSEAETTEIVESHVTIVALKNAIAAAEAGQH